MEKLTDFKPIKRIVLPDLGELHCSGLIVIVGPNSSGKSQLLHDISKKISGEKRDLVVATELEIETPEHELFIKCLKAEGYLYSAYDDNGKEKYVSTTTFLGKGAGAADVTSDVVAQWRSRSSQPGNKKRNDEYSGWFSRFLVTALFLENRLTSLKPQGVIEFATQPPTCELHALYLNDVAGAALTKEIQRAFSKAIWLDMAGSNILRLRVRDYGGVPSAEALMDFREMTQYRTIESEGDGMKSYVSTAISILLGRRPVCIIDEPELCLHPPQCYNLGQFIGENATSSDTATLVATHSSQILRGMIQSAEKMQIVRLKKNSNGFSATHVNSSILADAMKKPSVRAETVLDGIFCQAVTIIEGDGDRIVYQAAWEAVGKKRNFDIHFTTAGGTGGIADTFELYQILGIPTSVIADLDLITDSTKIKKILGIICKDVSRAAELNDQASSIAKDIRELPPSITSQEIKSILAQLAAKDYDWADGGERGLRQELSSLRSSLDGMNKLKRGGISALPDHVSKPLGELIENLRDVGLFLVPVGELEGWLSSCGIAASKNKKWAWANEAAEYISSHPSGDDDIWHFIRNLGDYLTAQVG